MKIALLLLASLPLFGASLVIDCGSPEDQYFTGGVAYTASPADDTTLRFSETKNGVAQQFSYKIPAANDVPYVVKFTFMEPSATGAPRIFVVGINDLAVLSRVTTQGYLVPFSRTVMAFAADGYINIRFDTIVRSAVISKIEITPLFELFGSASAAAPATLVAWSSCKSGLVLAGPVGPGVPSPDAMWPGLGKFGRNDIQQILGPTLPANGWSCDGLQAYTFKLPDGSIDGPYVAVKMPADFQMDPALWVKQ